MSLAIENGTGLLTGASGLEAAFFADVGLALVDFIGFDEDELDLPDVAATLRVAFSTLDLAPEPRPENGSAS